MSHRRLSVGVVLLSAITSAILVSSGAEAAEQAPAEPEREVPTEATLGMPIYPTAVYLTSYDAGRGQRYYLFGTQASFVEMVRYYSTMLDERGDRVFNAPATHTFEVGRFRKESMAFPPGVTIKDYTWNASEGYLNPTPNAGNERFPTVIQIVPPPADQSDR